MDCMGAGSGVEWPPWEFTPVRIQMSSEKDSQKQTQLFVVLAGHERERGAETYAIIGSRHIPRSRSYLHD
jgi:hypothetical protein